MKSFRALVGAQFLGAFNDNLFKQLLLFMAAGVLFPGEDKQGLAFAVFALPFVIFSGLAGDLSERFSKRSIIVRMKIAEIGIMVLGAIALQAASWPFLLVILAVMGFQSAIFGPSKYGVIPEIIPSDGLLRANSTITMTTFMGVLLGQALAGPLLDNFGDQMWISGAICTGFAVIGTLMARRMAPLPPQKPELTILPNPFGRLPATIKALRAQDGLFQVVLLNSLFWFNGGVLQQAILGLGDPGFLSIGDGEKTQLSYILVTIAVSIMVGSAIAPRVAKRLGPGRTVILGTVGMTLAQLALLSVGRLVDREGGAIMVAHICLATAGLFGAQMLVPLQSYLQDAPPPGMRGQTFAVNNFVNFLFLFFGGLFYMVMRGPLHLDAGITQFVAATVMLTALLVFRKAVLMMRIESTP